jgi:CrcB protein
VATLTVNLLGTFLLGLLLEGLARLGADEGIRRVVRLGAGTGFMGAFTTYSTLAIEANLLAGNGHTQLAIFYMLTSIIGGIICSALGIQIAAQHHKRREKTR